MHDDAHSHSESNVTNDKKLEAVDCCLNHDERLKVDPLSALNLHHYFVSANAYGSRSENYRMDHSCCSFFNTQRI